MNAATPQHVVLACDESEAKGYADRDEKFPGEVGVFAGILVPGELLQEVQAELDAIATKYQTEPGKVHITDLTPEQQQQLRAEIFEIITRRRLPCFFEAIHVAGFHRYFKRYAKLIEQLRASRRSQIKLSARAPAPESLHVALFFGLYAKFLAFCMERGKKLLHIEVRTDQVDAPIFKDFQASAHKLLDYGAKIETISGFDPTQNKVVNGTIETKEIPPQQRLPITIARLEFNRITKLDGLVLAADVLANSLAYTYRKRPKEERFCHLNRPAAVKEHPLARSLDAFEEWGSFDASDFLYPHPCDPNLIAQKPYYSRWWSQIACWVLSRKRR